MWPKVPSYSKISQYSQSCIYMTALLSCIANFGFHFSIQFLCPISVKLRKGALELPFARTGQIMLFGKILQSTLKKIPAPI